MELGCERILSIWARIAEEVGKREFIPRTGIMEMLEWTMAWPSKGVVFIRLKSYTA